MLYFLLSVMESDAPEDEVQRIQTQFQEYAMHGIDVVFSSQKFVKEGR
jgi:hypothetical protein